jgi:hypothetical protein
LPQFSAFDHEGIPGKVGGGVTRVTLNTLAICYTAINAFATVSSLSGDPDGSATTPHFLPAVRSSANFIASGN